MIEDLFQALYEASVWFALVAIVWAISNKIWGEQ
jgi:hypothetical protein